MFKNSFIGPKSHEGFQWQLFDCFARILLICAEQAAESKCTRSKCGSIIVANSPFLDIIGYGYNSRPCDIEGVCTKDELPGDFKSDKTCCIHAEQRAIDDALQRNSYKLLGSILFFVRLDENDAPLISGDPYCTYCSKRALDKGVKWFCLWNGDGWNIYETNYYNQLSFEFRTKPADKKYPLTLQQMTAIWDAGIYHALSKAFPNHWNRDSPDQKQYFKKEFKLDIDPDQQ
jgi:deoxycytidylate deaminase